MGRRWLGFAGLCVLQGAGWALDEIAPGVLHGLVRTAVHDGLIAVAFGVAGLYFRQRVAGVRWWQLAAVVVVMFGVPEVLFAGADGHVSGMTELLIFMLVPVVVVFTVAQQDAAFGTDADGMRMLGPAVAGLGGAVLVLPYSWPASVVGWVWLGALVVSAVAAGVAAVWVYGLMQGVDLLRGVAVIYGTAALVAAAFCWLGWSGMPAWSLRDAVGEVVRWGVVEVPVAVLTVWLLREMRPAGFAARFVAVPLVMVVASLLWLRPELDWTVGLGILLMAGGVVGLVRDGPNKMLGQDGV